MSNSKRKYFRVVTTQIVHANNKSDALDRAARRPKVDADILDTVMEAEQIYAADFKEHLEFATV